MPEIALCPLLASASVCRFLSEGTATGIYSHIPGHLHLDWLSDSETIVVNPGTYLAVQTSRNLYQQCYAASAPKLVEIPDKVCDVTMATLWLSLI
jgi:hypothetical protein